MTGKRESRKQVLPKVLRDIPRKVGAETFLKAVYAAVADAEREGNVEFARTLRISGYAIAAMVAAISEEADKGTDTATILFALPAGTAHGMVEAVGQYVEPGHLSDFMEELITDFADAARTLAKACDKRTQEQK